ncbi:hypothetical protein G7062_01325 [Erysipelothrix sp. HDW6C]|uniref:LuxR C-terminal-related transcriptional regulator n=1 Tax=Erysipelothrix sp. HDW6C TaxID=2714930 RepID=UPI00140BFC65|nr:LuxR C-terminal-related transcriptional regulator [Erysipelothrix sp. HDW6C]QIK69004.1 hypothetical protein G7062_01325 [Erysipelothrix sp. HDW6C]
MQLISAKMKRPELPKAMISRPNLETKLKKLGDYPLTFVEGISGTGKSLVVSKVVSQSFPNTVWLSLDATCNHVYVFWKYVMQMSNIESLNAVETLGMDALETALNTFINILNEGEARVFVFDDMHYINDATILSMVDSMIANLLPHIHIVWITQPHGQFTYTKYLMKHKMLLIRDEDLRLTHEESLDYLQNVLEYTGDASLTIANFAEGWVGGLHLGVAATIWEQRLDDNLIDTYLEREIFNACTQDEQRFMVETSILTYFNQPLIDAYQPGSDLKALLASFTKRHIMVQYVGSDVRYHHMWQDFLRRKFQSLPDHEAIRRRIVAIYTDQGDAYEAIEHLFELKDYVAIMARVVTLAQSATTFAFLGRVPIMAIVDNFEFAYQKLFYHYANMEFSACTEIFRVISTTENLDPQFQAFKGLEILIEPANVGYQHDTVETPRASELTQALVGVRNAAMHYYRDRFHDALMVLQAIDVSTVESENPYLRFYVLNITAQVYEELGYLKQALNASKRLQDYIRTMAMLDFIRVSHTISEIGILLKQYRLGDVEVALESIGARYLIDFTNMQTAYQYNYVEYLYLRGNIEVAYREFENVVQHGLKDGLLAYSSILKHPIIHQQLSLTLRNQFKDSYAKADFHTLNSQLVYVRLLLMEQKRDIAIELVDRILVHARRERIHLKVVEASLIKASIVNDARIQIALYKEALYYAHQDCIMEPFMEDRQATLSIIQTHGNHLLTDVSQAELHFHQQICAHLNVNQEQLTEREVEVLKALAQGKTNREIAERLFISLATVKTHLINLYRKLEVSSRVQAVQKGVALGIIKLESIS